MRTKIHLALASALCCLALLGACGGGGGGGGASADAGGGGGATDPCTGAPLINTQPVSTTVYQDDPQTFSVQAQAAASCSNPTLTYQWKKNGTVIAMATTASYTTPAATLADHLASYSVVVTGSGGGATLSNSAILSVQAKAPSIVTAPSNRSVVVGQTAQFSVTAAGKPTLTYQWKKGGVAISGATASTYTTPVTQVSDNASVFTVTVTNDIGQVTSSGATLTVAAPPSSPLTDLVISEVSGCYYFNVDCWFEIYNPTSLSVNLSSYSIKTNSIDVVTRPESLSITTFNLPSISIPAYGYVVVSGNVDNNPQVGTQNIKLRSGDIIPVWDSADGFIEILKAGNTVDFVVFGSSTQAPTTSGQWTGAAVGAITAGATNYGHSIVRPYPSIANTNTRSAADWVSVAWATPAGRNDVPADAVDADNDGIPDSAEVSGGTFAGLDLYAMGARTGVRDIFLEVDQMLGNDGGLMLQKAALQKVVDVFNAQNIKVHFDAGTAFSETFSVADFNLGQVNLDQFNLGNASNAVPAEPCTTFDQTTCSFNLGGRKSLYDWKDEYMDLRRRAIFHYVLMAVSQQANGSCGSGGVAEINGNDIIITLGGCGLLIDPPGAASQANTWQTTNFQAMTIMHELGHNLGLLHGGNEEVNYKPNYWSIMNYMYAYGLDPNPRAATAYQRWRYAMGDGTPDRCSMVASYCGNPNQFVMNYSNGSSIDLNEASLLESNNVGRGADALAYADWNLNGSNNSSAYSKDLNGDGNLSVLKDYDDWANLVLPFARYPQGNFGPSLSSRLPPPALNPMSNDRQNYVVEDPVKFRFRRQ